MAPINFTGLASGLDTRAIIDAILEAERAPIVRMQERQTLFSQRRAALDELQSKLNAFESALRDLRSESTFRGRLATVSDETAVRATPATGGELGLFSIEVGGLAAAHKVKSDGFATADQGLVGDGTITVQSGSNDLITVDVSAASGNNSLQAIRDAINAADSGVQVAIIFDGSVNRLTVRAEDTGTANALTITDSTDLNLDDVDNNEVAVAADAALTIDGIDVTSSSNRVTGVIPGVTLDLLSTTTADVPITVEVAQDTDKMVEAVQSLVSEYNSVMEFYNSQNDRENPGPLSSDTTTRNSQYRIQSLFSGGVSGLPLGSIRSLSTVGVEFDGQTGKAKLDTGELRDLLETDFEAVGDLFLSSGTPTSSRVQYAGSTSSTASGSYAVSISQAAEQATVAGATAVTALGADEILTIEVGGESVDVSLTSGMTLSEIIDAMNSEMSTADVEATAYNDGGLLRIASRGFGADVEISVTSDRDDPGDGSGTGFSTTAATDTGLDVEGTIGGVAASGSGQLLTGAEDGDYAGLLLKITATAAEVTAAGGDFGTVSFSRGFVDTVLRNVEELTRFDSGPIDLQRDSLEANIDRLNDDIDRFEDRIAVRETLLIKLFGEAERAISALQSQQATLSA